VKTPTLKTKEYNWPEDPNPAYPGVTLDQRLTWCAQIGKTIQNSRQLLNLMKK
jgi:hypothetical protein